MAVEIMMFGFEEVAVIFGCSFGAVLSYMEQTDGDGADGEDGGGEGSGDHCDSYDVLCLREWDCLLWVQDRVWDSKESHVRAMRQMSDLEI